MAPTPLRALLLVLLCATAGLGGPRCEVPPGAWDAAPRCGAAGGCAQRGRPQSTQDLCSACQDLVALLIRVANASAAEAALRGFLQRECEALPVPSMVTACRSLVSRCCERMGARLGGQLKPSAICAHLELCPGQPGGVPAASPHIGALLKDAALPVPLPLCWLCRTFLARAEAAVPKEAVAKAVSQLCRALPLVAAGACQCLAERYAQLLLEMLLGRLAPRLLCRLLLSCGPDDGAAAIVAPMGEPGSVPPSADGHRDPALWQVLAELSPNLKLSPNPGLSPKPGPCALGPAYWCSSAETAQRCEAQLYCQDRARL